MAEWIPDEGGWEHSLEGGEHRFRWIGGFPDQSLELGDVPAATRVVVVPTEHRQLTIVVRTAPRVTVEVRGAVPSFRLTGRVSTLSFRDPPSSVCSLTIDQAPRHLVLCRGTWSLGSQDRPASDRLRVELNAPGENVELVGGAVQSVSGEVGVLTLQDTGGDAINVSITGQLRTRSHHDFGDVHCDSFETETSASFASLTATRTTLSVGVAGRLEVVSLHADGSVWTSELVADEGYIGGNLIGTDQRPEERLLTETVAASVDEVGAIRTSEVRRPGSVQVRALSTGADSAVLCRELRIIGDDARVAVGGLLHVDSLTSAGHTDLSSRWMAAGTVEASSTTIASKHVHCSALSGQVVTSETLRIDQQLQVTGGAVEQCWLRGTASIETELRSTESLVVESSATVVGTVEAMGSVAVHDLSSVEHVRWKPAAPNEFQIDGSVARLSIDSTGKSDPHAPVLRGASIAPTDGHLTLTGQVAIRLLNGPRPLEATQLTVDLADDAIVSVSSEGPPLQLDFRGAGSLSLRAEGGAVTELNLHAGQSASVMATGPVELTSDAAFGDALPDVICMGKGDITFRAGNFGRAVFNGGPIDVERGANIADCRGTLELRSLDGVVSAARRDRDQLAQVIELNSAGDQAQLVGLDVTPLGPIGLDALKAAEVVEPDGRSLRRLARERKLPEHEVRRRSQWAVGLHRAVSEKATSGSTKARIGWVAARLQHRATFRHKTGEWAFRWVHRVVGYGYAFGPPLFAWLACSTAVTWLSFSKGFAKGICAPSTSEDGSVAPSPCVSGWGDAAVEVLHTAFFPFRLLRLSPEDPVFDYLADWAKPLAGLVVGFPFLMMLVAVRRFFSLTHDGK